MHGEKINTASFGQNNKTNSEYAVLVKGEGGSGTLDRIIDISAGSYGSAAVNEFGWNFVWGNGSFGEIGNGANSESLTPTKTALDKGISASMGAGHVVALRQSGAAFTWGRNTYGELRMWKQRKL